MSVRHPRLDRRKFLARMLALAGGSQLADVPTRFSMRTAARQCEPRPDRLRLSGSTYMLAAAT